VSRLETLLRRLDTPPWSAAYRMAIGFSVPLLLAWSRDDPASDWRLLPLFLFALLMLRLVPALVRRLLPFSADVRDHWARQRLVAKRVDSYQWRKLLWFGLGLAAYLVFERQAPAVSSGLAAACLFAGVIGALRWRHLTQSEVRSGQGAALAPNRRQPALDGR
jgi:hypothetical protein